MVTRNDIRNAHLSLLVFLMEQIAELPQPERHQRTRELFLAYLQGEYRDNALRWLESAAQGAPGTLNQFLLSDYLEKNFRPVAGTIGCN